MTRVSVRAVWVVDDDVSSAGAYSIVMTGPPQPPPPPHSHPAPPPRARETGGAAVQISLQQTEPSCFQTPATRLQSHWEVGLGRPSNFLDVAVCLNGTFCLSAWSSTCPRLPALCEIHTDDYQEEISCHPRHHQKFWKVTRDHCGGGCCTWFLTNIISRDMHIYNLTEVQTISQQQDCTRQFFW